MTSPSRTLLRGATALGLALGALAAAPAGAQTLAPSPSFSSATLERLEALEAELRRLTATVETLQRAQAEAAEETALQLRDLEFRIVDLEGGDPAALFGGESAAPAPTGAAPQPAAPAPQAPEAAAAPGAPPEAEARPAPESAPEAETAEAPAATARPSAPPLPPFEGTQGAPSTDATPAAGRAAPERAAAPGPRPLGVLVRDRGEAEAEAYEAAMRRLAAEGVAAAAAVDAFAADFPESPRAGLLLHRTGEAFAAAGEHREAARRFLSGYRDHRAGPAGLDNLLGLGGSLAALGDQADACAAYAQARQSYPDASDRIDAASALAGCP